MQTFSLITYLTFFLRQFVELICSANGIDKKHLHHELNDTYEDMEEDKMEYIRTDNTENTIILMVILKVLQLVLKKKKSRCRQNSSKIGEKL